MMAASLALGALAVWLGLILSYHLGTAGAATIALVAIAVFFLVLVVSRGVHALSSRRTTGASHA